MTKQNAARALRLLLPLLAVCCAQGQVPGTGRIEIKSVKRYSGAAVLSRPTAIVVYDFAATPEEVKLNQSVVNRARMRVRGGEEDDKTKVAREVVDDFTGTLVKELHKSGIPVSRGLTGDAPASGSLSVAGDFLVIDEGNRTRRMAVGLGAGASKVVAHVECSLHRARQNTLITEFQATSQSSRKPGAAETMGAGAAPEAAAAVGGVTEMKQGAEGDADRMAKAIAKQILKALSDQGWAPAT